MSAHLGVPAIRLTRYLLVALTVAAMSAVGLSGAAAHAQDMTPTVMLVSNPTYGLMLTDPDGYTLYTWEADDVGVSNCVDRCSDVWPPLVTDSDLVAPPGLPGELSYVDRGDGTWQVALDGWPLYYFSGDAEPGDVNGDGSMGFGARWDAVALSPSPAAEEPIPAPPIAQPMPPAPEIAQPPAVISPATPANVPSGAEMAIPANVPPGYDINNPAALPPGMVPPPGVAAPPVPPAAAVPPGYQPTLTIVVPPNGMIGLNWVPSPTAQSYRIYQTLSSQPLNFTVTQTVSQTPGILATNAVVAGLQPGNTYLFQVRAVDPTGNESPAPASAIVGPAPNAGIPGPGVGTPSTLAIGATTGTTVALTWTPIPGARSFVVLQANTPAGPFVPANMTMMTPSGATVVGLQPNTMYYFQLMAVDALGNQSPASGTVSLMTTPVAAATSAGVQVTSMTATSATLTWSAMPGVFSYQVVQSLSPNGPWMPAAIVNPTSNGATVVGLAPGSMMYFEVIGLDATGNQVMASIPVTASTQSTGAPVMGTTLAPPSGLFVASTTGSTATLSWAPSPGATSYTILQSASGAGPFTPATASTVSGTSATISGLSPNTTYFFQLVATDPMGHQSGPSNPTTAMTTSPVASPR